MFAIRKVRTVQPLIMEVKTLVDGALLIAIVVPVTPIVHNVLLDISTIQVHVQTIVDLVDSGIFRVDYAEIVIRLVCHVMVQHQLIAHLVTQEKFSSILSVFHVSFLHSVRLVRLPQHNTYA